MLRAFQMTGDVARPHGMLTLDADGYTPLGRKVEELMHEGV